jgi:glycosyltransferase involved in cell wall biosynthesis
LDKIVGILWNKNEGDILEEVILKALPQLDALFCADDGSSDNSWDIMCRLAKSHKDKIEHIQREPSSDDPAQRQALLDKVRERYKPENTWVQVIESDLIIVDTDIRQALKKYAHQDAMMNWFMFNGIRDNWGDEDHYPNWKKPITEVLNRAHYFEQGAWTYRPLKDLKFNKDLWRPWPQGFTKHIDTSKDMREEFYKIVADEDLPIMGHFGYRGPAHIYKKFSSKGITRHPKYTDWDMSSPEAVARTLPYFNGVYLKESFPFSREGLIARNRGGK